MHSCSWMAFITISLFLALCHGSVINEIVTSVFMWTAFLVGILMLLFCLVLRTKYVGRCPSGENAISKKIIVGSVLDVILLTVHSLWREPLFLGCARAQRHDKAAV